MGRTIRHVRPPASGAIIFYGRSGTTSYSGAQQNSHPVPRLPGSSGTDSTASSRATLQSHGGEFDSDHGRNLDDNAILEGWNDGRKSWQNPSPNLSRSLGRREIATGQVILRLAKDITDALTDVPYITIVVGLVQQIITIYDEIQANKDRGKELIEKVMTYARVIFEALLAINGQQSIRTDFSGIKEDLLQIANVLQSIYETLQYLTTSKSMSRLNRLLLRDDIASKLSGQDRRLDTAITAFQLKSSIVLRSAMEKPREYNAVLDRKTAPMHPRQQRGLRSKPQIMFGRNQEIDAVVNSVLQHPRVDQDGEVDLPPRICILGSGGIGKTTLALSILHQELICKKFNGERFFVSCEAATLADLFLNELAVSLEIVTEEIKVNVLQAVLRRLRQNPCLLVLDNFETSWDPLQNRSEIESLLTEITSLQTVTLITTMRGSQRPAGTRWSQILPPLQPIDVDSAISIFQAIAHKADKYAIDLIQAVDCVPLAVTLLANLAAVDGETTEALWSRWEKENTSMVENGEDRLNSLETSIQLSLSSPRMQRDSCALLFLSSISLLSDGVTPDTLRACEKGFPDIISVKKAISTLRQNALVYEDANKDLRILSPIRLYICSRHPPSSKSRGFLYDHFIKLALQGTSYHNPGVRSRLQREANNIGAILIDALASSTELNVAEVIQAMVNFCHYTYVSGKGSIQVIASAVEKLEALKISSTNPIVHPVAPLNRNNKGAWHKAFSSLTKPGKASSIAVHIPSNIEHAPKLRADCLGCWGQVLSRKNQFGLAKEKFELAKELHIEVGDVSGQAYDLLNIGLLLSRDAETLEDALEIFQEALKLHEKLDDQAGRAYDLLGSAHAYRDLGRFPEAENMLSTAAKLFEDIDDASGQASALNGLGAVMLSLSRCIEAEFFFTQAIQLSVDMGEVIGEADNIAGLAVTFLLRSRFLEARRTIEKAMALRQPVVDPDHLHILGRICIAMGEYNEATIHLSRSLSYHEDIGDRRGQAEDLLNLSYIEFYRGYGPHAQDLASEAVGRARNNEFIVAEAGILEAQVFIRKGQFRSAQWKLEEALEVFDAKGCILAQGHCLYVQAVRHLRCSEFDLAIEKLTQALDRHTEVGNIQGQADDLNKICEALMLQGAIDESMTLISEALALHIQIDDRSGQGDDLYIQASLFLIQGNFSDAELMMRKALGLHTVSESTYGIARDNASLSDIVWQQQQQQARQSDDEKEVSRCAEDPFVYLKRALELFRKIYAAGEFYECRQQKRRMRGKELRDPKTSRLGNWNTTSDDEVYSNDYYYDPDSDD